jgi:serine phosphatase RsbU (regulator of sigma subunit)/anti-sigma regulatory factor (Ser/Thr protein kinase)
VELAIVISLLVPLLILAKMRWKGGGRTLKIRRELQGILDSLEPIALLDDKQEIIRVNEAYARLCGLPFNEIIGKLVWEVMPLGPCLDDDNSLASVSLQTGEIQRKTRVQNNKRIFDVEYHPLQFGKYFKQVLEIRRDVSELYKAHDSLDRQKVEIQKQSEELRFSYQQINVVREQLEKNLSEKNEEYNIAREIQLGLLPTDLPDIPGVKFWSTYEPVSTVGGDLYDIISLGNHRYGIFIGDVAGHGLPAAFVGALAKMALTANATRMESPKTLLEKVNRDLLEVMHSGFYLTGFYGVLDLNNNKFRFTRASHPHPVLVRSNGEKELLNTKGLFLGAFEKPLYTEAEVELQQGDRLFFCTDGCFESVSPKGERLSYKDFTDIVVKSSVGALEDVYENLCKRVKYALGGEVKTDDDQTFLALEIKKPSREKRMKYLIRFHTGEIINRIKIKDREQLKTFMMIFSDLLQNEGYSEKLNLNISSSIQDLVLNSLEHGHKWDSTKNIMIAFCLTPKYVKVSVSDHGPGFNYDESIRQGFVQTGRRGQGLFYVKTYMDEVFFDRQGCTISVVKQNT